MSDDGTIAGVARPTDTDRSFDRSYRRRQDGVAEVLRVMGRRVG